MKKIRNIKTDGEYFQRNWAKGKEQFKIENYDKEKYESDNKLIVKRIFRFR